MSATRRASWVMLAAWGGRNRTQGSGRVQVGQATVVGEKGGVRRSFHLYFQVL